MFYSAFLDFYLYFQNFCDIIGIQRLGGVYMSDDSIKKNISKNITKYREQAGLSQKELAKRLGVAPSRVSNWETYANCPTIDILFEVCEVLGVSINDIYGVYPASKMKLSFDEIDLIKKYRELNEHGKEIVDFVLEKEYKLSETLKENKEKKNCTAAPESNQVYSELAPADLDAMEIDKSVIKDA